MTCGGTTTIDAPYIAEPLRQLAIPIADLNLDAANARRHNDRNIDAIARSLSRWGQRLPIVVQREGMIVRAGNGRLIAAKSLGWTHLACVVVDEASVEAVAFAIADNRTAELADWDDESLVALLQSLPDDVVVDTGFNQEELDEIVKGMEPPTDEDWAAHFEGDAGDASPVDREQITFVLASRDVSRLREHLRRYDADKNVAVIRWLDS